MLCMRKWAVCITTDGDRWGNLQRALFRPSFYLFIYFLPRGVGQKKKK